MTTAIIIGLVAVLVVSNLFTWVNTRLRNACDHYTPRHGSGEEKADVQEIPEELSALMDPAGPTRPDIHWQVTS